MRTKCLISAKSVGAAFLLSAIGGFTPSIAADEAAAGPSKPEASLKLNEVIVTARRYKENLQRVPIAITVVSSDAIQNNNVTTIQDVEQLVPSLTITTGNVGQRDSANVTIRGQGWGSFGQPATAMYLNEVPLPTDYSGNMAGGPGLLFDLENVQVLKGPQGTLFGRNTMGGAVLLQSARPTDDFGGRVTLGYGNYNNREVSGEINLPIVDGKLLARVAFSGQWRDGTTFVQSMPPLYPHGVDLDNRNTQSVRATLTFRPTDTVQNDTIVTGSQYSNHGPADFLTGVDPNGLVALVYGYSTMAALLAEQQALGARTHIPIDVNLDGQGGELFALQNITKVQANDWLTIKNIFGMDQATFNNKADLFGTDLPIFNDISDDYPARQYTDELQALGKSLNQHLDWVTGFFWSDQGPPNRNEFPTLALQVAAPAGTPYNVSNDQGQRQLLIRSKAIYGQATYDLSDWIKGLKVTAGFRNTWDGQDSSTKYGSVITSTPASSSAPTYTAAIDYQAAPDTSLYFTARSGYRSAGAAIAPNGVLFPYGPEYVNDFETGVKSDWKVSGVTVRTDADVYYQNYRDIQVNELIPYPGTPIGIDITANAASARLYGAEFEGLAILTHNLEVGVNLSYLKFEYLRFGPGVDSSTLIAGETANRIPFEYGVNVRYLLPVSKSLGDLSLLANWHWQDRMGDFLGTDEIPSYGLLNLSFNWNDIAGSPCDVQLYSSNLLNRTYINGGIGFIGISESTYGDPRMYGIRVTYRFGAEAR